LAAAARLHRATAAAAAAANAASDTDDKTEQAAASVETQLFYSVKFLDRIRQHTVALSVSAGQRTRLMSVPADSALLASASSASGRLTAADTLLLGGAVPQNEPTPWAIAPATRDPMLCLPSLTAASIVPHPLRPVTGRELAFSRAAELLAPRESTLSFALLLGKLFAPKRSLRPVRIHNIPAQPGTITPIDTFTAIAATHRAPLSALRAQASADGSDAVPAAVAPAARELAEHPPAPHGAALGDVSPPSVRLVVQVSQAFCVPTRQDIAFVPAAGRLSSGVVRPFVEVSFAGGTARTRTLSGVAPTWNERLEVPFLPPRSPMDAQAAPDAADDPPGHKTYTLSDYSPEVLSEWAESVHLALFDEEIFDNAVDDRDASMLNRRIESRWLGGVDIPFSTIYANGRVEGTFELHVPLINLGYPSLGHTLSPTTTLALYLTIAPTLAPPNANLAGIVATDLPEPSSVFPPALLARADVWLRHKRAQFPTRTRMCFANALGPGNSHVFLPRFLRPLPPPDALGVSSAAGPAAAGATIAALLRFVSKVPFVEDSALFQASVDVWNTSSEFLELCAGDYEEHALLLCNYLLFFNLCAYVLVGDAVPEGTTTWVLLLQQDPYENASIVEFLPSDLKAATSSSETTARKLSAKLSLPEQLRIRSARAAVLRERRRAAPKTYRDRLAGALPPMAAGAALINAVSGRVYPLSALPGALSEGVAGPPTGPATCPLRSVHMVFNQSNLWANVQSVSSPSDVSWDLSDPAAWHPFFADTLDPTPEFAAYVRGGGTVPTRLRCLQATVPSPPPGFAGAAAFGPLQPAAITYSPVPEEAVAELAAALEDSLMASFEDWRAGRGQPTRWNRLAVRRLRELLCFLEDEALGLNQDPEPQAPEQSAYGARNRQGFGSLLLGGGADKRERYHKRHIEALGPLLDAFAVNGFPLSLPWTDIDACRDLLKSTRVHLKFSLGVEFALAVHVRPYTNSVLSIWVYVAALTPKQESYA
jgi:hypothetical protein